MTKPKAPDLRFETDDPIARHYRLVEGHPYLPGQGLRIAPATWQASGHRDLVEIEDGFHVMIGNIEHAENMTVESSANEDLLKFHFRISGASQVGVKGESKEIVDRQTASMLLQPAGLIKEEVYIGGEHEQSVTLLCSREFFQHRFGEQIVELPEMMHGFVAESVDQGFLENHPLSADMARAANRLLNTDLTGALLRLLIEAKSLELLLLSVQAMIEAHARRDQPERGISQKDVERLQQVRDILSENFLKPPTIAELAKTVGTNEAKLMHSFKQLFGQTVFDFAQRLRMEKAKELLEGTDHSITEIAFQVGYEYSSNFTTAFKRFYGVTPRTAREAMR